jgi:hypothetical protein
MASGSVDPARPLRLRDSAGGAISSTSGTAIKPPPFVVMMKLTIPREEDAVTVAA